MHRFAVDKYISPAANAFASATAYQVRSSFHHLLEYSRTQDNILGPLEGALASRRVALAFRRMFSNRFVVDKYISPAANAFASATANQVRSSFQNPLEHFRTQENDRERYCLPGTVVIPHSGVQRDLLNIPDPSRTL